MAVLLLLPLQIIALGDEQHDQNTQGTGEFIVETAEGLNNLESDAKSSDLFWSTKTYQRVFARRHCYASATLQVLLSTSALSRCADLSSV